MHKTSQMKQKILFIGLTTVDIQYFLEEHPMPNTKHKAEAPFVVAGGPAANAAIAFAYMGGTADFLSCIGNNPFEKILIDDFTQNKVKVIDAMNGIDYQPIVASIITNTTNSERTIITHHPEPVVVSNVLDIIDLDQYDMVLSDGFYPELALPICVKAREKGIPIVMDGGSWKPQMADLLPLSDIAICSENFIPPGCQNLGDIFDYTKNHGVQYTAISRGAFSIISNHGNIEIKKVEAVDSLGAGDILHGVFVWYYSQNYNFFDALNKASVIATHSTLSKGTRSWMNFNLPV